MSEVFIALVQRLATLLVLVFYVPWLIFADSFEGRLTFFDAADIHWHTWLAVWKELR